jgi:hypothetical protein
MAFAEPFSGQQRALQNSVNRDTIRSILRTCRIKPAPRSERWRDTPLVDADQGDGQGAEESAKTSVPENQINLRPKFSGRSEASQVMNLSFL